MYKQLRRIDLNLLISLAILLQEKNTTRAANRLNISQSAMSRTLTRLRNVFDDPLFIRQTHGLEPTPKAKSLEHALAKVLSGVYDMVYPEGFVAATAVGTISLGVLDMLSVLLVPPMVEKLNTQTKNVALRTHNLTEDYPHLLESGFLDFSLYLAPEKNPDLISKKIGSYNLVCMMPKHHPLASLNIIDEQTFLATPQIMYAGPHTLYEQIWQARVRKKEYIFETSQLLVAIEMLLKNDAITLVLPGTKNLLACGNNFIERPLGFAPIDSSNLDIYLTQHVRTLTSPLHQWVSTLIADLIAPMFSSSQ